MKNEDYQGKCASSSNDVSRCVVSPRETPQQYDSIEHGSYQNHLEIKSSVKAEALAIDVEQVQSKQCNEVGLLRPIPSICCRICQISDENSRFISPCLCSGTIAYVHKACLERWLNTSGLFHCELCHYRFPVKMKLRHGLWQSLLLWYKHPNNREVLQADFLVCSLISVITIGIIAMSLLGLHFLRDNPFGMSLIWTKGSLILFLVLVSASYFGNVFLILRAQLRSWYRWWQSAREVKLVLINRRDLQNHRLYQRLRAFRFTNHRTTIE